MKICDLGEGLARLDDAMDSLQAAWTATAAQWDDPTSRRFYKERLEPLAAITERARSAIRRLAEVLARAERECGDQ